ncbi:hypothetical protein BGZ49_008777 [Haplosporangium sp. Z 27]|nr:hypothetical protein BGZ49_008777 [Haplosporangium sp. Z 27]
MNFIARCFPAFPQFRVSNPSRLFSRFPVAAAPATLVPSAPITLPTKRRRVLIKDYYVSPDESGMRLDRFLKHRMEKDTELSDVNNIVINKWLRKRQIKLLMQGVQQSELNDDDDELSSDTVEGNSSKLKDTVANDIPKSITKTVTSGTTRTEAGQTWRVRALMEEIDGTNLESPKDLVDSPQKTSLLPLQDWIIYMDERIIVLDKPAGVAVQGGTGVEYSIDNALATLQYDFREKPRIVHRLDMTTSGLLILARTRKAAQDLTKRFHDGTIEALNLYGRKSIQKKYVAIVSSNQPIRYPTQSTSLTTEGLIRLQGDMIVAVQGKRQSIRMCSNDGVQSFASSKTAATWTSTTDIKIASQSTKDETYFAILHLYPRTGRKHQLRVHCAQLLNAPILGDSKYSLEQTTERRGSNRIYLHMAELTLKDWLQEGSRAMPGVNRGGRILKDGSLVLRALIPKDMQHEIDQLGLKSS